MSSPSFPASSSSSVTATEHGHDVESHRSSQRLSHFGLLWDPTGITPEVLAWKYPGRGTPEQPYVVDFLSDDASNPMKFASWKKWTITILQALATLATAFVSSSFSGGVIEIIREFHISTIVATLGISLFVLGFAVGPLLWAPLSELYGRQWIFFFTFMALTVFNAAAAGAPNIASLLVFRFLGGTFGSSPFTNAGGVIADMFSAHERGPATAIFALAPFLGPSLGPIAGGFLGQYGGWRWNEGLMAAFTGIIWIAVSLVVPETYAPALLRRRAQKLSNATGKVYVSKLDLGRPKKTVVQEFSVALSRPWVLLFTEPIVFITSIYMAIVYGTLYMLFAAFPIVFQQGKGWSPGIGGLAFVGVAIGQFFAVGFNMYDNKRYIRVAQEHGGMAPPEARLPPSILGSILLPIALFWFAWTNGPDVHWVVPIIAGGFFSCGLVLVFLSLFSYLVDSYLLFAASALAANSILRSLFGAAFPLFTPDMYRSLGIHWASSIPAFLAVACVPFPILFWKYGGAIRMRSKFAAEAAAFLERMHKNHDEEEEFQPTIAGDTTAESPAFGQPSGGVLSDTETEAGVDRPDTAMQKLDDAPATDKEVLEEKPTEKSAETPVDETTADKAREEKLSDEKVVGDDRK